MGKFVTIHLEAHHIFQDVKKPLPESIKILNFKNGIRPEAGLESALDVARGLANVNENFDNFSNYLTEGVTNRRSRTELFRNSSIREVSSYNRGGRGRGRGHTGRGGRSGRGRGRGHGRGCGRGRGRGTSSYHYSPEKLLLRGKQFILAKHIWIKSTINSLTHKREN